jgi:type I restriction enzyme S subunit
MQNLVGMDIFKTTPVVLPPPPEQRAIAAALSDVDGLITALDRLIAKKRAIKQATMQQLLTGKTRLPGFGGEWETKRLGNISTCLPTASNPRSDLGLDGDIEYIHYGDVHAYARVILDCRTANLPRIHSNVVGNAARLEDGDLVMVDASEDMEGVGKSVEIQGVGEKVVVAGLHTILCRGNKDHWASGFKAYLQFHPGFKKSLMRVATGISVYGVSKKHLADVELALPAPPEQAAIAAVLSDMDAEIAALAQRRDKTQAIKQGMMQQLLTGRVRLMDNG